MVSRHYRNQLQQALSTADADSLATASLNWSSHARLLDRVSESIRNSGKKVKSEIEGQAGDAMVAKFNSISDKLDLDAADMRKGADAIGVAQAAAIEATKTHNGILLSGPDEPDAHQADGPLPRHPADSRAGDGHGQLQRPGEHLHRQRGALRGERPARPPAHGHRSTPPRPR